MDFYSKYNTPLSKKEEELFLNWVMNESQKQGRDLTKDLMDYDLRGAWKELQDNPDLQSENGHWPDTYKKPNHPTFSIESKYNGVDGFEGGKWVENKDGTYSFYASPTTLWEPKALDAYFKQVEPGNKLILPQYEDVLTNKLK